MEVIKKWMLELIIDNKKTLNFVTIEGFDALADMVERCDCYDFRYSRLDDAVATFDNLLVQARG